MVQHDFSTATVPMNPTGVRETKDECDPNLKEWQKGENMNDTKSGGVWDSKECALLLIDYQPEVMRYIRSHDPKVLALRPRARTVFRAQQPGNFAGRCTAAERNPAPTAARRPPSMSTTTGNKKLIAVFGATTARFWRWARLNVLVQRSHPGVNDLQD